MFHSKGLGKDGSGIVEPVETIVLPQGKNTNYIFISHGNIIAEQKPQSPKMETEGLYML